MSSSFSKSLSRHACVEFVRCKKGTVISLSKHTACDPRPSTKPCASSVDLKIDFCFKWPKAKCEPYGSSSAFIRPDPARGLDSWLPDEDRRHPFPGCVYILGVSFVGLGLALVNQVQDGL